jgi:hypothetical protein
MYSSYSFLTSALDGGEWSASRPGERTPLYPLYRRLGGPQSRSGHRGYRKNPFSFAGDQTPLARSFSPWPDIIVTELPDSHMCVCVCVYVYIYIYIHTYVLNDSAEFILINLRLGTLKKSV